MPRIITIDFNLIHLLSPNHINGMEQEVQVIKTTCIYIYTYQIIWNTRSKVRSLFSGEQITQSLVLIRISNTELVFDKKLQKFRVYI